MPKPVISVENLSKAYRIGIKDEIPDTLVGAMTSVIRSPFKNLQRLRRLDTFTGGPNGNESGDTLWALKDVSFDVQEGEVVGIIGRNGAGKSTLLKVLSRITEPTSGRAVIRGRVSSLLEVGTGFHPELTGRDNIYMNGTILGMTKREIDRKFDEIVDFSGVEKFLDTPVKRYSSGMQVRLAFAVAAHLEPEILIIDEVLAVGDAEFQKKCLGKMKDVADGGRTVLFVSHNIAAVESLCSRGIYLKSGSCGYDGFTVDTITRYLQAHNSISKESGLIELSNHPNRHQGCEVILQTAEILDKMGTLRCKINCVEPIRFRIGFNCSRSMRGLCFGVFICQRGTRLIMLHTNTHSELDLSETASGFVMCDINSLPLVPGRYDIDVAVGDSTRVLDYIESAGYVDIIAADALGTGKLPTSSQCVFLKRASWQYEERSSSTF